MRQVKEFPGSTGPHPAAPLPLERSAITRGGGLPACYFSGFTTRDEPATVARFSYDLTISPRLLNHFAAGFNRNFEGTGTTSIGQGWDAKLGITGVGT